MSLAASISRPPPASSNAAGPGPRPTIATPPAHGLPPPAGDQNHARNRARRRRSFSAERHHRLARHGRAFDIDCALRHAGLRRAPPSRAAKLRPIFMMTAASASARRRMSSSSGSVAGRTTSESSPQVIGAAAAPQAPQMMDTPGTIGDRETLAQADEEMHERAVEAADRPRSSSATSRPASRCAAIAAVLSS